MAAVAMLSNASKSFTVGEEVVTALDQVDLSVESGEFACIYGASGSGKTTMLNIVAGIETVDSGDVVIFGEDLTKCSEKHRADMRLRKIGVIFQTNNLLPEFTAVENVALPLMVRGTSRSDAREHAIETLNSVGLSGVINRLPSKMSGGQRQRVGIARALAGQQRLLVADEPTGALDSTNSRHLFELMRDVCDQFGTSVLLATHDPIAREFATSIHHMVDGIVKAQKIDQ